MERWKDMLCNNPRQWIVPVGGAVVGLGLFWAKANATPSIPSCLVTHPHVVRAYPGLAQATHQLAELKHAQTPQLVAHVVRTAELSASTDADAQWEIAREIAKTMAVARHICSTTPMHESDEQYRQVLACTGDVLPQLETWLDNLLTNHLLARPTGL